MKNSFYIFFLIIFMASCNIELALENPNVLSADSFWQDENDIQRGLIATYGALQLNGLLGTAATTELPVRSDVGRPNNWNNNAQSLNQLIFNENTNIVKHRWQSCYIGIYRANQVLANLNIMELDKNVKTQIEAETRFLRGFFYYSLYRGYNKGSVIIHTTPPESREDFYKKPSPAKEVYELILADLEFAEKYLPKEYSNSKDIGRATWGAAAAMLGKLYINEHNYELAREYFKAIIDSNIYELTPDIGDNFDEEHEFNSESIFEVAFSIDAKPGAAGTATDGPSASEGTSRATLLATVPGGGSRVIMPSYWMTMLFKNDTMDITNPINSGRTGKAKYSIRTSVSIALADDDNTTLYQRTSRQGGAYVNQEASYLKKFQNWKKEKEDNLDISGINERVIRLADVMLLYAECLLKTGGSYNEALDLVNEIRSRSGVVLLNESDYNEESLMEHIMWVERPLELMFEGHDIRWEDLVRWGKIKEQYERLASIQYVFISPMIYEYNPNIHTQQPLREFVEAASVYNPDYHNYFPIPSTELTSNPDIFN